MAFSAFLDTCVLVPSLLRDLLLETGCSQGYRPLWSDQVEAELDRVVRMRHSLRGRAEAETDAYVTGLLARMNSALPDARITQWQHLLAGLTDLPDQDDCHVVAAALAGRADVIVTFNLKHFPEDKLPGALFAQHPDEFLRDLLGLAPSLDARSLREISGRTGRKGPKLSVQDILDRLVLSAVGGFVADFRGLSGEHSADAD